MRYPDSGNANAVIPGIGVVTGGSVPPGLDPFWRIDYRLYEPDGDGKTTLDHGRERLVKVGHQQQWPFQAVLRDTGYATNDLMLTSAGLPNGYSCPVKANRQVDDAGGQRPDGGVDARDWKAAAGAHGQRLQLTGLPNDHQVRLFRVAGATHHTAWVVTNEPTQSVFENSKLASMVT